MKNNQFFDEQFSSYKEAEEYLDAHEMMERDYPVSFNMSGQDSTHNIIFFDVIKKFKKEKITIIDHGGGMGSHHRVMIAKFPDKDFSYSIIEEKSIVERKHPIKKTIDFYSDISQFKKKEVDIIHSNGSILYLKDPISVIKKFVDLNPKYIVLCRTPITIKNKPTFYTIQKFKGIYLIYAFFNFKEINIMSGYKKILQERHYKKLTSDGMKSKFTHECDVVNLVYKRIK